jgi:hypothetical protein
MSPEQAGFSGVDIDTRADIYSLGVILYELLTGLRPIDAKRLRGAALAEMIRIIQEEQPSKPSTRLSTDESLPSMAALRHTEPKRLIALLRGELDWVVMRCLEKSRERRYETVNGLARDIQRYFADEPVEARPPSARYRLSKFLRRNKGPVLAASMVLLATLAGLALACYGFCARQIRERSRGKGSNQALEQKKIADEATAEALAQKKIADGQKALAVENARKADGWATTKRSVSGTSHAALPTEPLSLGWPQHRPGCSRPLATLCPWRLLESGMPSAGWTTGPSGCSAALANGAPRLPP